MLENETTLPQLWDWLHNNARHWALLHDAAPRHRNLGRLDTVDRRNLAMLEACSAERWSALCRAAGATGLGAAALSWCAGATATEVWDLWREADPPLAPTADFIRPTQLLSPLVAPPSKRLSDLARYAEDDGLVLCIHVMAVGYALELDLPEQQLQAADTRIADFLTTTIGAKPELTPKETALHKFWSTRQVEREMGAK
ncbi:hypothetical protein [Roseobacter weihaiensis]|uniref:hypothetical protein n=1 Tax=Roseobacter weihaiensis TaxID=2763262 RepID=UPI001D0AE284|nr:hypothetical protein [Roseobacter sp. H9]